jgi:YihY family inner membrane protein
MNPIEAGLRRADRLQQSHTPLAFLFGVIKKYGDDNGGVLVANLAYAAFISLFPLLLILTTILGLLASSDPGLRNDVLTSVTNQVPVISNELRNHTGELRHSSIIGLVTGIIVLIWGTTRLAQAGIFTMAQVWNLPGPARPGYVPRLGRSALFLCVLGLGVIITTALASLNSFGNSSFGIVVAAEVLAAVTNAGMFFVAFRVLTPKGVPHRRLLPGAIVAGIGWTVLQVAGTYLVHRSLHSDAVYGIFATVLVLIGWIYLGVEVTVYAAEVNVVLVRRLWPRAIVQPPLTEADRASMALQALQNQRRPEQEVEVTFTDRPAGTEPALTTPRTPDEVTPPAPPPSRRQLARRQATQRRAARRQAAAQQPDPADTGPALPSPRAPATPPARPEPPEPAEPAGRGGPGSGTPPA